MPLPGYLAIARRSTWASGQRTSPRRHLARASAHRPWKAGPTAAPHPATLFQELLKPSHGAVLEVHAILWIHEPVTFARVHHEFRGDAQRSQCVPELVGLGRGTFGVALTNDDQRRRLDVLDELDRRALRVY